MQENKPVKIDSLAIAALVKELKPKLEGAFVNKIQELGKNYLKIKLHSKIGRAHV